MSSKVATVIISSCIVCTGCSSATRDCPAFNHPLAEQFTPIAVGESLMFSSNRGTTASYTLKSIEKNEPFSATARGDHFLPFASQDKSDIECELTEKHTYESDELGTTLSVEFDQTNIENVALEDQSIVFRTRFSLLNQENSRWSVWFPQGWITDLSNADSDVARNYSSSRTINQLDYPEISELLFADEMVEPKDDTYSEIQIKRIAMSFGFGLVEYELLDGTVYSVLR